MISSTPLLKDLWFLLSLVSQASAIFWSLTSWAGVALSAISPALFIQSARVALAASISSAVGISAWASAAVVARDWPGHSPGVGAPSGHSPGVGASSGHSPDAYKDCVLAALALRAWVDLLTLLMLVSIHSMSASIWSPRASQASGTPSASRSASSLSWAL